MFPLVQGVPAHDMHAELLRNVECSLQRMYEVHCAEAVRHAVRSTAGRPSRTDPDGVSRQILGDDFEGDRPAFPCDVPA